MAEKETFIVYAGWEEPLMELTDEERGKAFACMFEYNRTGKLPEIEETTVRIIMKMIVRQMENNNQKYEERCRKNTENARKRWDSASDVESDNAIASDRIRSHNRECEAMRNDANVCLYENENGNDNVNVNENANDIDNANVNVIGKDNKDNDKDNAAEKENPPSQARPLEARAASDGNDGNEKDADNGGDKAMMCGIFKNVAMRESEYAALREMYGKAADNYIDKLSQNIKLFGKSYDNPSEVIWQWMAQDEVKTVAELAPRDKPMPKGYELLKKRALFV